MTIKRRMIAAVLVMCILAGICAAAAFGLFDRTKADDKEYSEGLFGHRETLYLWYTDEALTDYLNSVAVSYNEYQDDTRVIPVNTSGSEYLETINQASLHTDEVPDLYIVGNDSLEKAYLAGLASEIKPSGDSSDVRTLFPESAIHAVTYHDKQIAYPFYFETSSFLYNKSYMEDWAKAQIEAEYDAEQGEAAQAQADMAPPGEDSGEAALGETTAGDAASGESASGETASGETTAGDAASGESASGEAAVDEMTQDEAEIDARVKEALPKTIDDILEFAQNYEAPEQVEAVFKWDVSDIFYNYFFVGDYIDVGGAAGDNDKSVDIYNENAIRCMRVYQNLNQFFSIDTKEISYADILNDFIEGKILYTVATTDALAKIEAAKESGDFKYEYGTSLIPDVNENLVSRSLSVTQCIVVNGYSVHKDAANDFALYLTRNNANGLYDRTGKLPALSGVEFSNKNAEAFVEEYEKSIPNPKMIETSNYWVEMEIAFARIWDGEDANSELKSLSEKIMTQINGEDYVEEYIDVPAEEPEADDGTETEGGS